MTLFGRGDGVRSVDLFCGMGGASLGIHQATGRSPLLAVNHNEHAIALHTKNHPDTIHLQEDVFEVVPRQAVRGWTIDLGWYSPQCTHFSNARGGKPMSDQERSQAQVVVMWAKQVKPRCIIVENVVEFLTWGPLHEDGPNKGRPIEARKGEFFRDWVRDLEAEGYVVQWKALKACDYGVPTIRKRVYIIARRGVTPPWPLPTHGPDRSKPWRGAWECIDWDLPCPSIFLTPQEARKQRCRRPLAKATLARIAEGVKRFVLESPRPFLLQLSHGGRLQPIGKPIPTITSTPKGGDFALVSPTLINTRNGERKGQRPRALDIRQPMTTATAQGSQGALICAFLDKTYSSARAGQPVDAPMPTVSAGGNHAALVYAFLSSYYGEGGIASGLDEPMPTVPCRARHALITVTIDSVEYVIVDIGMRMLTPRELARGQGFPDDYILEGTLTEQIERVGNSVCPGVARALVEAQRLDEPDEVLA
jgi:DNA (cytosine-5)-methyltransferase 1